MRPALFALLYVFISSPSYAGLTGTPADLPDGLERLTRGLVLETLGAPQTANFRRMGGFRLSDGGWAVCGQVNSRNLTGLKMGWKPIFVRYSFEGGQLSVARRIVDWPADVACRRLAMGRQIRTRD